MKNRLIAVLVGLALAGGASAQSAMPPEGAAPPASPPALGERVPPMPPGCRTDRPPPPPRRDVPDFSNNTAWRAALGVSESQATQVQQVFKQQAEKHEAEQKQRRAEDEATCAKLRRIVGDKAMKQWSLASMPPPPPRPPMPPPPPEPPMPPMPLNAGQ